VAKNLNSVVFQIEGTFQFGAFGGTKLCVRNAYHNNVGGYMKGRVVMVGEKVKTKYPALPPPER
jgi:hypothetical protein